MGDPATINPSLNLTPERGPSVWTASKNNANRWTTALVAGGSLLAAYAWTSRSRHRPWLASVGVGAIAYAIIARPDCLGGAGERVTSAINRIRPPRLADLDDVDRLSKQSFPASDAPAVY